MGTGVNQGKESITALEERLSRRTSGLRSVIKRSLFRFSAAMAKSLERLIEIMAALAMTLAMAVPLYVVLWFRMLFTGTPVFTSRTITGVRDIPLRVLRFNKTGTLLRDLPLFFYVITGQLALVGTTVKEWSKESATPEKGYTSMVKPGIISLWKIRSSSKIGHQGQPSIEWEYIFKKHPFYDFMLLLRALPAMLYSEKSKRPLDIIS